MPRRTSDLIVGTAVLAVVATLTGATLWVKEADIGEQRTRVVARFHDVGNVRVGNAVVIRGVRAGNIEAIELAPGGWVHVRMRLAPEMTLPRAPVVLLNESSLFGEWQATITERTALPRDETVVAQVTASDGGGDVLPGATLPDIAKLTAVAGQIAGDVANVADRVEVAFDENAARELRGSIRNFAELSATMAHTVRGHAGDLDTLSRGLQTAIASLGRTAASAERMAARVDTSTSAGEMRQIVSDVARAAVELRNTTTEIHTLTQRLGQSQGRLDSFLANGDAVLAKLDRGEGTLGLLLNDPSLYRRGDSLLVSLRELAADLKAHPKRYVNVRLF
jgi:phospholipid/cholesterol/gamma-HCH transport system substrate-binding protein